MTYTDADFLTEVGTRGFIQAVTNAMLSLLPESDEDVPPVMVPEELSISSGVNAWSTENLTTGEATE